MDWHRVEEQLRRRCAQGQVGLIPYLTVGFPDVATTLELVPALEEAGADIVELGVPFSDPLADGATIQRASFHALQQGVTLEGCLEVCERLRHGGVKLPLLLMSYYNPLLAYGIERLAQDTVAAGAQGFIVPDLPAEEAGSLANACSTAGLCYVPLLAPTSTEERIARACALARGFVYLVSIAGVTGVRAEVPPGIPELVGRVRRHTALPVAVGFGLSRRAHIRSVEASADAAVVGSALISVVESAPQGQVSSRVKEFIRDLREEQTPVGQEGA